MTRLLRRLSRLQTSVRSQDIRTHGTHQAYRKRKGALVRTPNKPTFPSRIPFYGTETHNPETQNTNLPKNQEEKIARVLSS